METLPMDTLIILGGLLVIFVVLSVWKKFGAKPRPEKSQPMRTHRAAEKRAPPVSEGHGGRIQSLEVAANLPGPGEYNLKVVGTSKYQPALDAICGGKTDEGQELKVRAVLIHEDENPYDKNAIRVDIEGRTIGYLSRGDARSYRKQLSELGHPGITAACSAMIVGGWDDGEGDAGDYGVRLDLPT